MAALVIGTLLLGLASLTAFQRFKSIKRLPLPPGPQRVPLLGNLFQLPRRNGWLQFKQWSKQFGSDILYLDVAGVSVIVLNSTDVANELLSRRSSIYSSRPHAVMLTELSGCDWAFATMPYNDYWKQCRRIFTKQLNPIHTLRYQPQQLKFIPDLLLGLLDDPDRYLHHIRRSVGTSILSITYGIEDRNELVSHITLVEEGAERLAVAGAPGAFLVDFLPWLKYVPKWFPGAGFQHTAEENRWYAQRMLEVPFATAKKLAESGMGWPSLVSRGLSSIATENEPLGGEKMLKDTAATVYAAGGDTTVASLQVFFLAMLSHPDVQTKAQKELDSVLENARLPAFEDKEHLPYISAIMLEVLRWHTVTPLGIPHVLSEDDEYNGYHLPASSIVVGNNWAMLHDERVFLHPDQFNPDRFISEGKLVDEDKVLAASFGFGRRICPGRHIGVSELWIVAASVLSVFDITKAEKEPALEFTTSLISTPLPFECAIKPRSEEAQKLIRAVADSK
ncbi:cytochrome P450 family protein [Pleurotus pulmonarius]